ncbi:MAG: molybdopterin-binding protein, partial [Pseudonocardia sp.]|nr:molybdopterin-binding protein [Pseudonocardia sp.]
MSTTAAPPQRSAEPERPGAIPGGFAALIGVLGVGAALAAGHLVAGLLSPGSSPFFAVADTVIRLSPSWLTEFGKSLGPVLDKLLLQVGVGVFLIVVAVVAGIASRRRAAPGLVTIAVLGVLGFLAVVFGPAFRPLDLAAPVASLV